MTEGIAINLVTLLFVYIVSIFGLMSGEYSPFAKGVLYVILFIYLAENSLTRCKLSKSIFIFILVTSILFFLSFLFSDFDNTFKIKTSIDLLMLLVCVGSIDKENKHHRFIGGTFIVLMILQFILDQSNQETRSAFFSIQDPNRSAYVAFLIFCISIKFRFYFGCALSIFYNCFFDSRSFWLMLIIYSVIYIGKHNYYIKDLLARLLGKRNLFIYIFGMFFLASILSVFLSIAWIANDNESVEGRGGLTNIRDASNKMRFMSNILGVADLTQNKNVFLWGYGDDLLEEWGIDGDSDDTTQDPRIEDVRIVQPHNSYINLFLRSGIPFGLFTLLIVAYLMQKVITFNNIEIFVSSFFNTLFLHGILSGNYLIFLFTALAITKKIGDMGYSGIYVKSDQIRDLCN